MGKAFLGGTGGGSGGGGGEQPQLFAPIVDDTYTNAIIFSTNPQNGDFADTTKATIDGVEYTSPIIITEEMDGKTCRVVSSAENFTSAISEKVLSYVAPGEYSENLLFSSVTGGYQVYGIGTCKDLDIRIPPTYNGQNVLSIRNYCFQNNTLIKSVTIPNTVTTIGTDAFSGCSALASVTIPDTVTSIGQRAFKGTAITAVTIPSSVQTLDRVFIDCAALTNVTLNEGLKIIDWCFIGCDKLTNITIPSSVRELRNRALYCGSSGHKVTFILLPTIPPIISSSYDNPFGSYIEKIIVPKGWINTYKTATNWGGYARYMEEAEQ